MHKSEVVAIALSASLVGWCVGVWSAGLVASWKSSKEQVKRDEQNQMTRDYVRRSLDNRGFKILGGLDSEIDLENKMLVVSGELSSRSFPVAKDQSGSWHVYVYNRDGERRLMSRDDFELALFEVRDEPRNREKQAGLDAKPAEPTTTS
jgi:hypothetical protein